MDIAPKIWQVRLKPKDGTDTTRAGILAFHFDDQDYALAAKAYLEDKFKGFDVSLNSINIWIADFSKIEQKIEEHFLDWNYAPLKPEDIV